jgi:hypothetical protein
VLLNAWIKYAEDLKKLFATIRLQFGKVDAITAPEPMAVEMPIKQKVVIAAPSPVQVRSVLPIAPKTPPSSVVADGLSGPEQRILNAIAWMESLGIAEPEQTAVAFLADYTYGGGGFNNPKGSLRTKGLIEYRGDRMALTDQGRSLAATPEVPLTTEELHHKVLNRIPGPEQKLLRPLLEVYPNDISKEDLAERSGYKAGTGGFNNPCGKLRTLGLVEYPSPGRVKAKSLLFLNP